jgi:hypothetical protein
MDFNKLTECLDQLNFYQLQKEYYVSYSQGQFLWLSRSFHHVSLLICRATPRYLLNLLTSQ